LKERALRQSAELDKIKELEEMQRQRELAMKAELDAA